MFVFFLFIFSHIFCLYNLINFNEICPNKEEDCSFYLTYNYPLSPKIPTSFLSKSKNNIITDPYRYVYLTFNVEDSQTQKEFYLEAYDTLSKDNLISNGDCYLINLNENNKYEIQFYKELNNDSFIRFEFFGISKNFSMFVNLNFPLDLLKYFGDEDLDDENSKIKSSLSIFGYYLDQKNQHKNRETLSKMTCNIIMEKIFNISLDENSFYDSYYNSIKISVSPYLLVTLENTVGFSPTTENYFKPEKNILSETTVIDEKIYSHFDRLYFINETINNNKNVIKMVELYNKRVLKMISKLANYINYFTLTISSNSKNDVFVLTFKIYSDRTKLISYEIQINIQFTNLNIKQISENAMIPTEFFFSKTEDQNVTKSFDKIFFGLGIFDILKTINPELDVNLQSLPIFDDDINSKSINLLSVLHGYERYFSSLKLNTNKLISIFLDMKFDNQFEIYYPSFESWQQKLGSNKVYDIVFDLTARMQKNNEGIFSYNNQTYVFWAWKGDYINIGAGAELGIYVGDSSNDFSRLKVDKSLAMSMTLSLKHIQHGIIVENWNCYGEDTWWVSAFNTKFKKMRPKDLTAYFTVKFKYYAMFLEFAKTERNGWSYNKNKMTATLIF